MRLTVVIPTRERVDTLEWSIKTCMCQDYDDFEIIVSDNASRDGTADLVRSYSDPRIRYINTGKRVGMSQNWEFALSHVRTGYVFFMGDDDGLLPDAIETANKLLTEHRVDALAWKKASYTWPSHVDPNGRNCLVMPVRRNIKMRNSRQMLRRVCSFDRRLPEMSYEQLPGLYNSFVTISAIDKARDRSGRFFCSQIPDVYSAVALTSSVENYIYSNRPLSINGASSHSGGTSYMKNPDNAPAKKFLSEDNIPFHRDLLMAPSVPIILTESVWQVRDNVPNCEAYDVDLKRLFAKSRRLSLTRSSENKRLVETALERVREARGLDMSRVARGAGNSRWRRTLRLPLELIRRFGDSIFFYAKQFPDSEVGNVYEAALHCRKIGRRNRALVAAGSWANRLSRKLKR